MSNLVVFPQDFTFSNLSIGLSSEKKPYHRRNTESKTSIHWGQRKLFLSELEFFTIYWDPILIPNPLCVYAGAAPGIHIPLLSQLFPSFTFHLYDPTKFEISPSDKIILFNEYFTDDVASRYVNLPNVFFVSDIRTADYKAIKVESLRKHGITSFDLKDEPIGPFDLIKLSLTDADLITEDQIWGDMSMQQSWLLKINPIHALLKFRLPYALSGIDRIVPYLKGSVYWQVWSPQSSTETRLKPTRNASGLYELSDWSILEYEQWNFHHNSVIRESSFYRNIFTGTDDPIDDLELTNDYDSMAEAFLLKLYCTKFTQPTPTILYANVIKISRMITWFINKYFTDGNDATVSKLHKTLSQRRIAPKKYVPDAFRQKDFKGKRVPVKHTVIDMNPTWRGQLANPVISAPVIPKPVISAPIIGKPVIPVGPRSPIIPKPVIPVSLTPRSPIIPKPVIPVSLPPRSPIIHKPVIPVSLPPRSPIIPKPVIPVTIPKTVILPKSVIPKPVIPVTIPKSGNRLNM